MQVLGHADPVPLGTVVTLPEDTEDIRRTEYTVVGQVQDPQYFSATQETSTVGDGILDALVFVQDGELTADYYTVCYLKVADAAQYDNYSDEYQTAVDTVADRLDAISKEHCVARRAQLIEDATTQLDDAKQTYSEQKAEAERQFAQAEQKLTDAQRELDAANAASGKPYQIEISIGCARLEPDIATVHDLIDKADQEMYHLKTRKRGTAPAEKQG